MKKLKRSSNNNYIEQQKKEENSTKYCEQPNEEDLSKDEEELVEEEPSEDEEELVEEEPSEDEEEMVEEEPFKQEPSEDEEEPVEEEPFEEAPSEEEPVEDEPIEEGPIRKESVEEGFFEKGPSEEEPNEKLPFEEEPHEDDPSEEELDEDESFEDETIDNKLSKLEPDEEDLSEEESDEDDPSDEDAEEDEPPEQETNEDETFVEELSVALEAEILEKPSEDLQLEWEAGFALKRSTEKKRFLESTLVTSSPKKYKGEPAVEALSDVGSFHGRAQSSNALNISSKKQQSTGNSGKRRRTRWDSQPDIHGDVGEDTGSYGKEVRSQGDIPLEVDGGPTEENITSKRRKTRWSASDDSKLKMLGPIKLPNFMNELVGLDGDPEYMALKLKLMEITKKLRAAEFDDERPLHERSLSPPPIYSDLGIRINTKSARLRAKLILDRQEIIRKMIGMNPSFKPPPDKIPAKLSKKLYIPVKEYPSYNFIGLIIGPRGSTQRRMEKETGSTIQLRGKDSSINLSKRDPNENDDLHILVQADNQESLDKAVGMIEKLLIPMSANETNAHKLSQLKELAKLKKILRGGCKTCGMDGHLSYLCPSGETTFSIGPSNTQVDGDSCKGYSPLSSKKKNAVFVGCLPIDVNDQRLKELFNPYGNIESANVIMDWVKGSSKGYGFVMYDNPVSANTAVAEKNGFLIDGKKLIVRVSNANTNHPGKYPSPMAMPQVCSTLTAWPCRPGSVPLVASKQDSPGVMPQISPQMAWSGLPQSSPQVTPNQATWPGPPRSIPQVSPNQMGWPGTPGSVPQVSPNQMGWSDTPGSVSQVSPSPSQIAWPGPPGSEPSSSSRRSKIFRLPPVSIFPGHSEPPEVKQFPSPLGPASGIPTSSSPSTMSSFYTPPNISSGSSSYISYSYTPSISFEQLHNSPLVSNSCQTFDMHGNLK